MPTAARLYFANVLRPRTDAFTVAEEVADIYERDGFMIAVREAVRHDVDITLAIALVDGLATSV